MDWRLGRLVSQLLVLGQLANILDELDGFFVLGLQAFGDGGRDPHLLQLIVDGCELTPILRGNLFRLVLLLSF